jgi:hypothetical protein
VSYGVKFPNTLGYTKNKVLSTLEDHLPVISFDYDSTTTIYAIYQLTPEKFGKNYDSDSWGN